MIIAQLGRAAWGLDRPGFEPRPCPACVTMSKSLNRVKPQFLHVKWEKQWYLCHSRLVWGLNRIIHVLDTWSSLNGNGCCSKCHPHHCHHSSFYIHFQYHMEDSSWSKRQGCNLVARQGNFSLFPFGSNHWHSAGEVMSYWMNVHLSPLQQCVRLAEIPAWKG